MTTALGFQIQPPYAETDFLWASAPTALGDSEGGMKADAHHRCIYPQPVYVPHNQTTGLAGVKDQEKNILADVPGVFWDITTPSGAVVQALKDTHWGFEYLAVTAGKTITAPRALTLLAETRYTEAATTRAAAPLRAQEVEVWLSRSLLPGVGGADEEDTGITVDFEIGGYWYSVTVSASRPAQISRSTDGEASYQQIKSDFKGTGPDAGAMGATGGVGGRAGEMMVLRTACLNGRVSLSLGGSSSPVTVPQQRDTRTAIMRIAGEGAIEVPPGSVERLPPMPFEAQAWDGSGAPLPGKVRTVTVTAGSIGTGYDGRDTLFIDGDLGGIRPGGTLDILDPRITAVRIGVTGFTHFAFSVHPKKYRAAASWVSALKQVGFPPQPQTLPYFTLCGEVDGKTVDAGVPYTPYGFIPESGAQATASTETAEGETLSYRIDINGALPIVTNEDGEAEYAESYPVYGGQEYCDDAVVLTRSTVRIDGLEKPPPNAYVNVFLGVGGRHPVKAISESISFDPASLTINHRASVTLDNQYGVSEIFRTMGVGVSGNVGVAIRMGYEHQRYRSDFGGLGFPRFYGFSPGREFNTPPGGAGSTMTLSCVDQMEWLREATIAAPANIDGHNHYHAMAYLAQCAGIPLRRLAFAPLVPLEPFGVSPNDPDPYFLPVGYGFQPWTPINRTMSVLELMDSIRKLTGSLLFFDARGYLRYEPWIPLRQYLNGPLRVFTEVEPATWNARDFYGGLNGIWDLHVSTSTVDVRNQIILIGVDSEGEWQPIVIKLEDLDSISSAPGYHPGNYKGFRSPFVWMDSRFATPAFALKSALKMYRWLRQPSITVTFNCWAQPDLFPMDMIAVHDWRTGLGYLPLTIMSMSTNMGVTGGNVQEQTTITARYLDPVALSPF